MMRVRGNDGSSRVPATQGSMRTAATDAPSQWGAFSAVERSAGFVGETLIPIRITHPHEWLKLGASHGTKRRCHGLYENSKGILCRQEPETLRLIRVWLIPVLQRSHVTHRETCAT